MVLLVSVRWMWSWTPERYTIEKKVRRFVMRRKGLKGFGWKRWSREDIYKRWGLYNDYQIRYISPKATPNR
ncbi:MAG: hypothetical protein MUP27_06405 [Desulfobacterales bacterium]|jgi:RNA-directed DNA polymerase|nr:hypothetical protein [Desulfobacterales bacterium]